MTGPVEADLPVTRHLLVPAAELSWRFSRASGPGGQGVNTTDSRVELTVDLTTLSTLDDARRAAVCARLQSRAPDGRLTVVAAETRSQLRNRGLARDRLAALLAAALAPPPRARRPTRPTRGSKERRLAGKKQRSTTKKLRGRPTD
ncbi:alternative ribosome rescue aminoacyl-tRNA hydrolase ArfB [Rhodococcus aerolatus]